MRGIHFVLWIQNSWDLIFLGIFSFLTRFFNLSSPPKVVFDEAHFGLYATKYFSHQYYFDIHPPLGKMLLAISGFFGGIKSGFNFEPNSPYGDFNFLALRFLPALFGSLLVLLIYFFVKEIGFSKRVAFLAGFLILFDNAFVVQSRLILLDIILVFFIFLSLYLFILAKKFPLFSQKWYLLHIFLALSLGAAISIKWTGFGALGIIWFLILFEEKIFSKTKKETLIKLGLIFLTPILIYFLIFALHFYLLPLFCSENCGFIYDEYLNKDNFSQVKNPPAGNLFAKFIEANRLILASNLGDSITFYYQSEWFSWPFMIRPIQYFKELDNVKTSYIYFLGNPIIWWLGILGIIGYFYLITKNFFNKFKLKIPQTFYSKNLLILILGYLLYFLPFLSIQRSMLIYHYLPALIFSLILFSIFFEGILEMIFGSLPKNKLFFQNKKANLLFLALLIIVFLSFLYFAPLTYGLPLTDESFQNLMWLDTWEL